MPPVAPAAPHVTTRTSKTSASAWFEKNKWLVAGGAGVALLALYEHSKNASASSTGGSADALGSNGSITSPYSSGYDSTGLDEYNQLEGQLTGLGTVVTGLQQQVSGLTVNPPSPPAPTPAPSPASDLSQYPQVDIGGTSYYQIGTIDSAGKYQAPQVGGGAPVYFGGISQGVAQGSQAATPGASVFVPAQYGNEIGI